MHVLVAIDKFKYSLEAKNICEIFNKVFKDYKNLTLQAIPFADGGEGTCELLGSIFKAKRQQCLTFDPLDRIIESQYYLNQKSKTAIIEMSSASGIKLLNPKERNPLFTNSYGTGLLIKDSINKGAKTIIIGLGGSATNDLGLGALQALGVQFRNNGKIIKRIYGRELKSISDFDNGYIDFNSKKIRFIVLCDVENILCGSNGAAKTFARQKGATIKDVSLLEEGALKVIELIKRKAGTDINSIKYGGAAGGMAAGLNFFLNAELKNGFDFISEKVELENKIQNCDLVITGEGKLDQQSLAGKVPVNISRIANKYNKKTICFAGINNLSNKISMKYFDNIYTLESFAKNRADSIKNAKVYLHLAIKKMIVDYNLK